MNAKMNKDIWYDSFMETLSKKFPKKSQLTKVLMDLLLLEREAVYRRLRKDVLFTVYEVVTIVRAWNISFDNIINAPEENSAFQLKMLRSVNLTDKDFKIMESFVESLASLKGDLNTEYIEACNIVPLILCSEFPHIIKFYAFAWMHRYGGEKTACPFSQIVSSERMMELERIHFRGLINIANIHFIWDAQMIHYLINEISYYVSIYLITPGEANWIKQDILAFLDYMENVLIQGHFPGTNNKVHLYISRINIDTAYACYYSETLKVSKIRTFIMNVTVSKDHRLFNEQINWLRMSKRTAIQISGADEKQRIDFFRQQRKLVNSIDFGG